MRILITGGAGFIGTNTALEARSKKHQVIIYDSFIRYGVEDNALILQKAGCKIIRGDIRKYSDLDKVHHKPDAIIHLAANPAIPWSISYPRYDFETNALGTLNILEYSRLNGKIPVIFASTNKVYSEEINLIPTHEKSTRYVWYFPKKTISKLRPQVVFGLTKNGVNENFPIDSSGRFPHSPYGVSKAAADFLCQEYYHMYGIPTVINRMSCVYGLFQKGVEDQGWTDWFIRAKKYNLPINIYGDGKQVRDVLFGSDLAKLFLLEIETIKKVKGQVFNIGGGTKHNVSLLETINLLDKKPGKKLKLKFKPWRKADHKIYISNITKVKKVLGWEPKTKFSDGIDQMWEMLNREI